MQWLLLLVLAENTYMAACWAANKRQMRTVLELVREDGADAAHEFLDSTTARHRIAKLARSVAKDYLQDQAEARGEVWQP